MQMRSTLQALMFLTITSYINNAAAADELANPTYRFSLPPPCVEKEGNQGFCLNDTEYNSTIENLFRELLEENPSVANISSFLDEANDEKEDENSPNVRSQMGNPYEQTVCASTRERINPRRGRTINNEWVFILNQRSAQQGLKIEKCLRPGSPCTAGGGPIARTKCKQKFVYRDVLTMGKNGKQIHTESVYMPSCCVCHSSIRS
ncbi:UNVERIFIED_CONTAM: hypothetical protein RMT77_003312 [Armadillidium vulgare]